MKDLHKQILGCLPSLRRYSRALTGSAEHADDLVQESLTRAIDRLHLFKPGTNIRSWLFTILHNQHINLVKREAVRPDRAALEEKDAVNASVPAGQEQHLAIQDIQKALEKLPKDQREVVLLIGLEELSYIEASEVLGIPVGTVMSRLSRGRAQLRKLMSERANSGLRRVK
ncbi:MAG: sigma-70 family RNA polymerase sigma factor [Sneathiellales bacterium]|nr:sigma-70 family RNA polymerase sigma factor [Sneathiellales bacterium]